MKKKLKIDITLRKMKALLTTLIIVCATSCFAQVDTVQVERYFTHGDWQDLDNIFEISFEDDICTIKQSGKIIYQDVYAYNGVRLWTRYDVFVVNTDLHGSYVISGRDKRGIKLERLK